MTYHEEVKEKADQLFNDFKGMFPVKEIITHLDGNKISMDINLNGYNKHVKNVVQKHILEVLELLKRNQYFTMIMFYEDVSKKIEDY
jgi:hypothetical protein